MDMERHIAVVVSSVASMKTFIAVKSDCFMQFFVSKLGCVESYHIVEIDPGFAKITLLGSSLPTKCLPEFNGTGEVYEEQQSPGLFSP